jgi:hypothetical protein
MTDLVWHCGGFWSTVGKHRSSETGAESVPSLRGLMLWTVFATLLALWLLGIVSSNTFGGFIHVLLALAIAAVLMRGIGGERSKY